MGKASKESSSRGCEQPRVYLPHVLRKFAFAEEEVSVVKYRGASKDDPDLGTDVMEPVVCPFLPHLGHETRSTSCLTVLFPAFALHCGFSLLK